MNTFSKRSLSSKLVLLIYFLAILLSFVIWQLTSKIERYQIHSINDNFQNTLKPRYKLNIYFVVEVSEKEKIDSFNTHLIKRQLFDLSKKESFNVELNTKIIFATDVFNDSINRNLSNYRHFDNILYNFLSQKSSFNNYSFFIFNSNKWIGVNKNQQFIGIYRHFQIFLDNPFYIISQKFKPLALSILKIIPSRKNFTSNILPIDLNEFSLSFTLLNENTEDGRMFYQNFEEAYLKFFNIFSQKMKRIFNFQMDSHVLHFGKLSSTKKYNRLKFNQSTEINYLYKQDLKTFVGNTKQNIVSTNSDTPSIEFMVFVPSSKNSPLFIKTEGEKFVNYFTVPKQGCVKILNIDLNSDSSSFFSNDTSNFHHIKLGDGQMFSLFYVQIGQIRNIIGLNSVVFKENKNLSFHNQNKKNLIENLFSFNYISPRLKGITDWEYDSVVLRLIQNNLDNIRKALSSLNELISSVTHLPVESHIYKLTKGAIFSYEKAYKYCLNHDYYNCLKETQTSLRFSRLAFFDSKMLPALYFSNEFMYGVYFPFFAPIILSCFGVAYKLLFKSKSEENDKSS